MISPGDPAASRYEIRWRGAPEAIRSTVGENISVAKQSPEWQVLAAWVNGSDGDSVTPDNVVRKHY